MVVVVVEVVVVVVVVGVWCERQANTGQTRKVVKTLYIHQVK